MNKYWLLAILILSGCSKSIEEKVDRLFTDYQGERPGAAVMVILKGEPVLTKVYGIADLDKGIPVIPQTNFRLASVTKQFTAMAALILVDQGKLDLTTTLTEIFPSFPQYGSQITMEHLLQHSSGLIAYENLIPDTATVPVSDRDVLMMMQSVDSTYFESGSEYRYSNSGYAVLAMVVEQVSGLSFAEYLKENIFDPLGMTNTVAFRKGISEVANRAYGYVVEGDSVRFNDQSMTSSVLGDGGIYTSLVDMFKWDQALYTDKLVSKETLERAFTPGIDRYGYGWYIEDYKGKRCIFHTGSTCGFRTVYKRFPDDQISVVILTNRRDPGIAPLADEIIDLYL